MWPTFDDRRSRSTISSGWISAATLIAAGGLDDLLDGVWRRNPTVNLERSLARLERHQPQTRWPGVTVVPPQ